MQRATARMKLEAYLINRRTNGNVWYSPLEDIKADLARGMPRHQ